MGGSRDVWDLVVVGGGLDGLVAAWAQAAPGRRVVVLEAARRLGGRASTVADAGHLLEEEPALLTSDAEPLVRRLLGEEAVARGEQGRGPARIAGAHGPLAPQGSMDPHRLLAPLRRGIGRGSSGALDRLAEAAARATWGVGASTLGAGDAFPRAVAEAARRPRRAVPPGAIHAAFDADAFLVRGGTQRLIEALAADPSVKVRTACRVDALLPGAPGALVGIGTAAGGTLQARSVLLAVGPHEQARLLATRDTVASRALAAVGLAQRVTLHLGLAPRSAARLPHDLGFLSVDPRPARLRGALCLTHLDPSRAPPGQALLHGWFTAAGDERLDGHADDLLVRIAAADLQRVLGWAPAFVHTRVVRRPKALPLPVPGLRGRMAAVEASLAASGIGLLGRHVRGADATARLGVHVLRTRARPPGLSLVGVAGTETGR